MVKLQEALDSFSSTAYQTWGLMSVIPALWRGQEFKIILSYKVGSRPVWVTWNQLKSKIKTF